MGYKKRTPRRSRKRKTKKQTRTHRRLQKGAADGAAPVAAPVEGAPADVEWIGRLKLERLLELNYTSRDGFRHLDEMAKVAYTESDSAIADIEARAEIPNMTPGAQRVLAQDIKDAIVNIALVEYKLQTNKGFLGYIQGLLTGLATEEAQKLYEEIMAPNL
jgi:hypothetical protein